ncbi:MAG: carbon monoxide dehydrogenase, partial [Geodermatophilaceae bacterium]|nr:carbon monoxide dehydrogenase [Geodermatophilaceae bacterium]
PAPARSTPAPAPARPAPEPEPIDLLELAGGSMLTRAVPVAAGAVLLALLVFLLRRRR